MRKALAALIAVVLVLVILVVWAYVWYNYMGWEAFTYGTGDSPAWTPAGGDVSKLRFKSVIYTVTRRDGVKVSYDVTSVLNGMAVAYVGAASKAAVMPPSLTLTRPLNPFSFVIPGFNDSTTVADPTASLWCSSPPASCSADAQCPGGASGSCSCSVNGVCPPNTAGTCFSCPGSATATLTGKWRTI